LATSGASYVTQDALGSTRVVTGQDQGVRGRYDYLPFGEEVYAGRSGYGGEDIRQRFTGKERDEESGLDYFEARYFASAHGRFTTTDPVTLTVERLADPQQINLYAYCRNNLLAFLDPTGEVIDYANKDARKAFEEYEEFLNTDKKKYATELATLDQLKKSEVTYVINLAEKAGKGEGELTTDGNKIFVNINNVGGPQGEEFSRNSRFGHELEHARQFDSGEMAFYKDRKTGEWRPSPASYDIGDEVKAWKVQQKLATATDYFTSKGGKTEPTLLREFANAKTDNERADVLSRSAYPSRNPSMNSNVRFSAGEGYKPGQLIRPTDRPNFFGRVYKP
jgi:RHS repeat-associated protein